MTNEVVVHEATLSPSHITCDDAYGVYNWTGDSQNRAVGGVINFSIRSDEFYHIEFLTITNVRIALFTYFGCPFTDQGIFCFAVQKPPHFPIMETCIS